MPSAAEITARLKGASLSDSEEEMKERVVKATRVQALDPEPEPGDDPRDREEYPFTFNWTDSRGKVWHGDFVNKILNVGERQQQGVLLATLQGGMPFESFSPFHRSLNTALSHLAYSLQKRPSWAKDLRKLLDPDLVLAVFEEVAGHEEKFWGRSSDPRASESQEPDEPDGS